MILTLYTGPLCAVLAEQFSTNIRYTALSISYGFAVALFGGFAQLISTGLIRMTADPLAPAFYVIGADALSVIAALFVREDAGRPMPNDNVPLASSLLGRPA